jgi:hypothetical protein
LPWKKLEKIGKNNEENYVQSNDKSKKWASSDWRKKHKGSEFWKKSMGFLERRDALVTIKSCRKREMMDF